MPLYIGIDGGGSKTTCVLGDESTIFATTRASGSNVIRMGEAQAAAALRLAISQACVSASVSPLKIEAACIGAAGAGRPEVQEVVRALVGCILPRSMVRVVGDNEIALEAVLQDRAGVVVIAGTGSMACGRNENGETARAGGFGAAVSDEGSGQWIGRQVLSAALRAGDITLLKTVMQHWGLESQEELIQFVNQSPAPDFSSLLSLALQASRNGDKTVLAVLNNAGAELASLAGTVLQKLWQRQSSVRVGVVGGVFANSPEVRLAFFRELREQWPMAAISLGIADPTLGALSIARRM